MNIPSQSQIESFIQFMEDDHSWYKHLYVPRRFYILINKFDSGYDEFGGLYYFTNLYSPPYGFQSYKDLKLPAEDGSLTLDIPGYVWEKSWIDLDRETMYKSRNEIRTIIENLIEYTKDGESDIPCR